MINQGSKDRVHNKITKGPELVSFVVIADQHQEADHGRWECNKPGECRKLDFGDEQPPNRQADSYQETYDIQEIKNTELSSVVVVHIGGIANRFDFSLE